MKNIVELRNDLVELFDDLKNNKVDHMKAKEMNNAAGKIMTSLKVQLEYAKLHKKKVDIQFLNGAK